jgi:transposase InsO family protein
VIELNPKQERVALFRYGVIAPLICRPFESAEEKKLAREETLSKTHTAPDGSSVQVSDRTLRWWIARYKTAGLAGLCDGMNRPRRNKGTCTAISTELIEQAVTLRREKPNRTVMQIVKLLESSHNLAPGSICRRTLARQLRNKGATRQKLERGDGYFQRRECLYANEMWQADTSFATWLPDPTNPNKRKRTKLIAFIDDASRLCVHAEFYFDEKLPNLVDAFSKAMLKRGKPNQLLLDNGSNYRSLLVEGMCAQLEIELSFCKPRRPQGKGKIERWFRTLKESWLDEAATAGIVSLDELNKQLHSWIEHEYHTRVHSEIDSTPTDRWNRDESRIRYVCADEIRRALMIRERRRVHPSTSSVVLDGEDYQVSPSYAGESVEVRWHPDRIDEVEIWHDGTFVEVAQKISRPAHVERRKEIEHEDPYEPLESSKTYLRRLSAKFTDNLLPNIVRSDLLAQNEFIDLVASKARRTLLEKEIDSLRLFFLRFAPLARDVVEKAVLQAIEAKGGSLHVRVIIQHLQDKIQAGRK